MDTELDIRLDITGLHIVNKAEVATAIDDSIDELSSLLTVKITDDEIYKTYKDARRLVKNERDEIWSTIKDKVNDFEHDIIADRKELYGKYDEIYSDIFNYVYVVCGRMRERFTEEELDEFTRMLDIVAGELMNERDILRQVASRRVGK